MLLLFRTGANIPLFHQEELYVNHGTREHSVKEERRSRRHEKGSMKRACERERTNDHIETKEKTVFVCRSESLGREEKKKTTRLVHIGYCLANHRIKKSKGGKEEAETNEG
jgi:hypothetical protein